MPEKPLNTYLKAGGQLSNIIAKARLIKQIETLVRAELSLLLYPDSESTNEQMQMPAAIHVANYHHGCLSLITDNAAVATRLRFLIPELTNRLRSGKQLPGLANIEFKTGMMIKAFPTEQPKQAPYISPESSKLLKETLRQLKKSSK
jgi:hypothetical protein